MIEKLENEYSRYWWSRDEESLFHEAMKDPFKNIVFTLLSQNTSSENTRRAYLGLIRKLKVTPQCLVEADEKKISEAIRPGGLHRVKAGRIKEIAKEVLSEYDGDLSWVYREPKEVVREKIMRLPGVGDKTADVLISSIHGHREAMVVDTHMRRIAVRLGLVEKNAPYQEVQKALTDFFPWNSIPKGKEERTVGLFWMLAKHTCAARASKCDKCLLAGICEKRRYDRHVPHVANTGKFKKVNSQRNDHTSSSHRVNKSNLTSSPAHDLGRAFTVFTFKQRRRKERYR